MSDYIKYIRGMVGKNPIILCGAAVIAVNPAFDILLQRRTDNGCWGLPGGYAELDERVEDTARRELFEESGITALSLRLFDVFSGPDMRYTYPNGDQVSVVSVVYICEDWSGEATPDGRESAETRFFPIDALPDKLNPPEIAVIERYIASR